MPTQFAHPFFQSPPDPTVQIRRGDADEIEPDAPDSLCVQLFEIVILPGIEDHDAPESFRMLRERTEEIAVVGSQKTRLDQYTPCDTMAVELGQVVGRVGVV